MPIPEMTSSERSARFGVVLEAVDAPAHLDPLVRAAFPDVRFWARIILQQPGGPASVVGPPGAGIRRLHPADEAAITGLSLELAWIARTGAAARLDWPPTTMAGAPS
jgi:hypothetical protein